MALKAMPIAGGVGRDGACWMWGGCDLEVDRNVKSAGNSKKIQPLVWKHVLAFHIERRTETERGIDKEKQRYPHKIVPNLHHVHHETSIFAGRTYKIRVYTNITGCLLTLSSDPLFLGNRLIRGVRLSSKGSWHTRHIQARP